MRKIVRRVVEYQCEICKTKYDKENQAKQCEERQLEARTFKVGDRVRAGYEHRCDHKQKESYFLPKGVVIKVKGPEPMDEDYSHRCLGSKLFNYHVFTYEVEFRCFCGKIRQNVFFSPEIKKNSR